MRRPVPRGQKHWCVLSPHSDDASWSIGGMLFGRPPGVRATLVTLCTYSRCSSLPDLQGNVVEVTSVRRDEDSAYARFARLECSPLRFRDIELTESFFGMPSKPRIEGFRRAIARVV